MSNNNVNLINPIKPITAPSLNSAEYGSQLRGVFENIDANFRLLGNADFIKGETGNSAKIKREPFFDIDDAGNKKLSNFGIALLKAIDPYGQYERDDATSKYVFLPSNSGIYSPVNGVTWYSNFFSDDLTDNYLYVVYGEDGNSGVETPYTSLYYIFLDGRFASNVSFMSPDNVYDDIEDLSCIAIYNCVDNLERFDLLKNAFPTMYYEDGIGLCWKVNGSNTGMPVRGIPGKDGQNSTLHIVKGESVGQNDEYKITHIYKKDEFAIIDSEQLYDLNGQAAVILADSERLVPSIDAATGKPNLDSSGKLIYVSQPALVFYFGQLYVDEDTNDVYAKCNSSNAVNIEFSFNEFYNTLKNIDLYNDSAHGVLKGLFLPINKKKAVHLLAAADSTGHGSSDHDRQDLVITPIDDIDAFDAENKNLNIDKYLYVTYNVSSAKNEAEYVNKSNLKNISYALKYKLYNIVNSIDSLKPLFFTKYDLSSVLFPKYDEEGNIIKITDYIEAMPASLNTKVTETGIYVWRLLDDDDDFDVDEFNGKNPNYNLEKGLFEYIFTNTSSPGIGSDIFYFSAIDPIDVKDPAYSNRTVVRGWSDDTFKFLKYVPIFNTTSKYNDDTTLTVNYDVNITGDKTNCNRTLTVTGDINCDNIKVYRLSAAKEIQNIYTNDDIVGNKGIRLSRNIIGDKTDYLFNVNGENGDMIAGNINVKDIKSNDISAQSINSDGITCKGIDIMSDAGDKLFTAKSIAGFDKLSSSSNEYENSLDIDINFGHSVNINRSTLDESIVESIRKDITLNASDENNDKFGDKYIDYMSNIQTDMPIICKSSSNIAVTDTNDMTNVWTDTTFTNEAISCLINNKEGVKNEVNFDSVKNYMMLRLADDAEKTIEDVKYKVSRSNYDLKKDVISAAADSSEWTSEISLTYNEKDPIVKYIIDVEHNTALNASGINISLGSYTFRVGLHSDCTKGNWPYMNSESRIDLKLYYSVGSSKDLKSLDVSIPHYNFDNCNIDWLGYDEYGSPHKSDKRDDWRGKDRFYSYTFTPKDISLGKSAISKLVEAYDNVKDGECIMIHVIPEINIKFNCENNKKCIKYASIKGFMPKHSDIKNVSGTIKRDTSYVDQSKAKFNDSLCVNESMHYKKIKYSESTNTFSIANVCKDGVVFRSGDSIFGLGYCHDFIALSSTDTRYGALTIGGNGNWKSVANSSSAVANILYDEPVLFYVDKENGKSKDFIKEQILSNDRTPFIPRYETPNIRFNHIIKAIPLRKIYKTIIANSTSSVATYGV